MKRLFLYLLDRFSKTEKQRIKILTTLDDKISDEYSEQTPFGNVYNYFIEFAMANPFIVKLAMQNDKDSLDILKKGIEKSFDEAIVYIQKENKT